VAYGYHLHRGIGGTSVLSPLVEEDLDVNTALHVSLEARRAGEHSEQTITIFPLPVDWGSHLITTTLLVAELKRCSVFGATVSRLNLPMSLGANGV
jgi:hypothetical protein